MNGQQLIVLAGTVPAEDGGYLAVLLWLRVMDAKLLWVQLERPAGDGVLAGVWRRQRPGCCTRPGAVTAVHIESASEDVQ